MDDIHELILPEGENILRARRFGNVTLVLASKRIKSAVYFCTGILRCYQNGKRIADSLRLDIAFDPGELTLLLNSPQSYFSKTVALFDHAEDDATFVNTFLQLFYSGMSGEHLCTVVATAAGMADTVERVIAERRATQPIEEETDFSTRHFIREDHLADSDEDNVPAAEHFGSPRAFFPSAEEEGVPHRGCELQHSNVSSQEQRQAFEK